LGPILFVVTCLILVLFQKDVGQTMLIVIIFFSIIFYSGIGVQNMLKWGTLVAIGFIIVSTFMFMLDMVPSYLQARFSTLTNP
ncbi:FtsW/RodA/SpoVE family cell cycle protein, partial [Staphylococcus caprae]